MSDQKFVDELLAAGVKSTSDSNTNNSANAADSNDAHDYENSGNISLLLDVQLRVTVELGRTKMQLRQVLELQQGSVVELDRLAGDPVDIYINERQFARGEVIVVDDKFGVRITELVSSRK
jgi:flagellar motor switch protein FliN/FliY